MVCSRWPSRREDFSRGLSSLYAFHVRLLVARDTRSSASRCLSSFPVHFSAWQLCFRCSPPSTSKERSSSGASRRAYDWSEACNVLLHYFLLIHKLGLTYEYSAHRTESTTILLMKRILSLNMLLFYEYNSNNKV